MYPISTRKGKRCGRCPDKEGTTYLNTVGITRMNLLRGLENLGVQLLTNGQASKIINGSNSFKFEHVLLLDLGPTFAFEESMELRIVDVMKILAEKFI